MSTVAEGIARAFHDAYEELAPSFGYRTREASAKPWDQVPHENRNLMTATVEALIEQGVIEPTGRADQLAEAVKNLADFHHRTIVGSRLHDPEHIEDFRECPARSCRGARAALDAANERES